MKSRFSLLPAALLPLLLCILPACRTSTVPQPSTPPVPSTEAEPAEAEPLPPASIPVPVSDLGAGSGALHILRWDPLVSSFTEDTFLEGIDRLDRDGKAVTSWSLHDWAAVRPGDWAIFARVGGEDMDTDGIAGICRFTSLPYEALSWRGNGTTAHYAEIDLRLLNDPASTGLLSASELESVFPAIDWHGGHSGVPVPPGTAAPLALVIADRLAAADAGNYPPDSFAAAENGLALSVLPGRLVAYLCPGLRADLSTTADAPSAPLRIAVDWPTPFDPNDTYPSTFHTPSGDITVPFMNRDIAAVRKTLPLAGWSALVLPLAGDAFELLLLVPPRNVTTEDFESLLPEVLAAERIADGHTRSVFLSLPKTIVPATGPVLRSSLVELDEGSPSNLPPTTPLPPPQPSSKPARVLLNRPFALALRDTQTTTLLFLSIVTTPIPVVP